MKLSNIFLSCALLFVPSLSLLRAAPVHSGVTPEEEATKTISELQGQAAALADQADQFRLIIANNESSRESHLSMLDTLKADINAMGRDLQTLEAERGTLSPWQVQAVDHSEPLLKHVAANTEQASVTSTTTVISGPLSIANTSETSGATQIRFRAA